MKLYDIKEPDQKDKSADNTTNTIFGVDLGTTNSIIALSSKHTVNLIEIDGSPKVPSVVCYNGNKKPKVGKSALKMAEAIHSVKRDLGAHKLNSAHPHNPIEVSAEILRYLKQQAEQKTKHKIDQIVLTVPAYFDENARSSTKQAAKLAGLTVRRMINEPTAAAIAYGLDHNIKGHVLVFDMGGGTFDVSILKMQMGVFQVVATGGDNLLGGDDYDQQLLALLPKSQKFPAIELRSIKEQIVKNGSHQNITLKMLEQKSDHLTVKAMTICKKTLKDAKLKTDDISHVIMVGGSTRLPFIKSKVAKLFSNSMLCDQIDPDLAVAMGAAYQGEVLSGSYRPKSAENTLGLLIDVVPLSLGIELADKMVEKIIFRNSPLPIEFTKMFTTAADGQTSIKMHIVQGEADQATACRSIARFELKNIPSMQAGQARLEVTFKVDVDGILSIDAHEKLSNNKQHVELKPTYGLDTNAAVKLASAGAE